jgi:Tfp pilus assembly protein PilF
VPVNARFRGWLSLALVRVHLLAGRRRAALLQLDRALEREPLAPRWLASRAHVLAELGETAAALEAQEQLVRLQPEQAAGWFNLGFLCEAAAQPARAEQAFRQALAIDPLLDRAWYGLALTLIAQRRLDEAVVALRHNTELQPMSPYGWVQLARVHVDRQEMAEAERIIRHLRGFEPRFAARLQRETGLGAEPV